MLKKGGFYRVHHFEEGMVILEDIKRHVSFLAVALTTVRIAAIVSQVSVGANVIINDQVYAEPVDVEKCDIGNNGPGLFLPNDSYVVSVATPYICIVTGRNGSRYEVDPLTPVKV